MEDSVLDKAMDILHERRMLLRSKLGEVYKRTKPFRMEPIEPKQYVRKLAQGDPTLEQYLVEQYEAGKQRGPMP